jgi:hypothetical protein
LITALLVVLAGCRTQSPTAPEPPGLPASSPTIASNAAESSRTGDAAGEVASIIRGRIVSRNDPVRFVVVELIFSPVPEVGRRLDVYRGGTKVGELRASRWNRGALVVADIIHGDAQPGDDVRAD